MCKRVVPHRSTNRAWSCLTSERGCHGPQFLETPKRTSKTKNYTPGKYIEVLKSNFIAPERARVARTSTITARIAILIEKVSFFVQWSLISRNSETNEQNKKLYPWQIHRSPQIQFYSSWACASGAHVDHNGKNCDFNWESVIFCSMIVNFSKLRNERAKQKNIVSANASKSPNPSL